MINVDVSTYFDAEKRNLGRVVLQNRCRFEIPLNQRPWVWTTRQLQDLWEDFDRALDAFFEFDSKTKVWRPRQKPNGYPHFIGTFLVVEKADAVFEVFDGQQRLTALSMMIASIRDYAQLIVDRRDPSKDVAQSLVAIANRWLHADPQPGEDRIRLALDSDYAPLFRALVDSTREKQRTEAVNKLGIDFKESPVHKRLRDSFHYVTRQLDERVSTYPWKARVTYLNCAEITLSEVFLCIWANIKKEAFSFQVFASLNARGVPLSPADNIKNLLFEHSPIKLHDDIVARWRRLSAAAQRNDIGEFLRRRQIGIRDDGCKKAQLLRVTRDEEIRPHTATKIVALVDGWLKDAELLHKVVARQGVSAAQERMLRSLFETLRVSLASIWLLGAARRYLPNHAKEFSEAIKAGLSFGFRELTIRGQDTPKLEDGYGAAARRLHQGKSLSEAISELSRRSPDEDFRVAFSLKEEKRAAVQFYILYELEKYMSGGAGLAPFPQSPKQHVEHVLPQKTSKQKSRLGEWIWARRAPVRHNRFVNRLGNLLILEADINRDVSNYDFDAKCDGSYPARAGMVADKSKAGQRQRHSYADSSFKLTKDLLKHRPSAWTVEAIEERQRRLADMAVKVWAFP